MNIGAITINELWGWILAISAAIVSISKAFEILSKRFKPDNTLKDVVNDIVNDTKMNSKRIEVIEKKLAKTHDFEAVICRVMIAQLNHELSGNDTDKLRSARDELNQYLTNR